MDWSIDVTPQDDKPEDGLASKPWWVQILTIAGPVAAIAMFLVYQQSGSLMTGLNRIEARVEAAAVLSSAATKDQEAVAAALIKQTDQDRVQMRSLIALVRQVCINTARNDEARKDCVK